MTASCDPSTRYVLPADAPYLNNLAALWCSNPALARAVEALDDDSSAYQSTISYQVEASRTGCPTVIAHTSDGRAITLHSKYNPAAEAQKLIDRVKAETCVAFYLLGLGLGYPLEALFDRTSGESLLFVFEPDLRLIRTTLEQRDLSRIISSGRLLLFTAADKSELFTKLTPHSAMCSMGFEGITHAPSLALYPEFYSEIQTWIAEPKASPKIFDVYPGPVTILGNDFADRLLRELSKEVDKGRLRSGATVAHLAYYLAEHLGCDPIVFVGQDLGFSDGLAYAPGTNIDEVWRPELSRFCTVEMKQWEFIARDRQILRRIPDHEGKPMYTEERLFTYLQQFERDFLRTTTQIIDATEVGAKNRGATTLKLAQPIQDSCQEPLPTAAPADGKPGQQR